MKDKTAGYKRVGSFHLHGIRYPCKKIKETNRMEILPYVRMKDKLTLEKYEYKGAPAYYVIRANVDIGVVPEEFTHRIKDGPYLLIIEDKYYFDDDSDDCGLKIGYYVPDPNYEPPKKGRLFGKVGSK